MTVLDTWPLEAEWLPSLLASWAELTHVLVFAGVLLVLATLALWKGLLRKEVDGATRLTFGIVVCAYVVVGALASLDEANARRLADLALPLALFLSLTGLESRWLHLLVARVPALVAGARVRRGTVLLLNVVGVLTWCLGASPSLPLIAAVTAAALWTLMRAAEEGAHGFEPRVESEKLEVTFQSPDLTKDREMQQLANKYAFYDFVATRVLADVRQSDNIHVWLSPFFPFDRSKDDVGVLTGERWPASEFGLTIPCREAHWGRLEEWIKSRVTVSISLNSVGKKTLPAKSFQGGASGGAGAVESRRKQPSYVSWLLRPEETFDRVTVRVEIKSVPVLAACRSLVFYVVSDMHTWVLQVRSATKDATPSHLLEFGAPSRTESVYRPADPQGGKDAELEFIHGEHTGAPEGAGAVVVFQRS